MRVEASRCLLRHEGRSYGTQQARNLCNGRKPDKGSLSGVAMRHLFWSLDRFRNKWWARRLPAAAVITAPQGVVTIIGPKASVAGLISLW